MKQSSLFDLPQAEENSPQPKRSASREGKKKAVKAEIIQPSIFG